MPALELLVTDLFTEIWQRFTSEFANLRYSDRLVGWKPFYCFCGRQSFTRHQARLLAAAWQEEGKVEVRKHGVVFLVEQPVEGKV